MDFSEEVMTEVPYDECVHDGIGKGAKCYQIDGTKYWIPKSLIESDDGEILIVPTWLAFEKGLI